VISGGRLELGEYVRRTSTRVEDEIVDELLAAGASAVGVPVARGLRGGPRAVGRVGQSALGVAGEPADGAGVAGEAIVRG